MSLMSATTASSYWRQFDVTAMGSPATVIVGRAPVGATDWAASCLEQLEQCWSRFRPTSELSDLNRSAGRWFPMTPMLASAVTRAVHMATVTSGRFDPTILRCLIALGYDRSFPKLCGDATAPRCVPSPGVAGIELDGEWIMLPAGVELDLGGIGKGLAADIVAAGLIERGATSACVSLGGDVRVIGEVPEGGWPIPVADPSRHGDFLGQVILSNGALVTSTVAFRRWTQGGVECHHIIDPETGDSARTGVRAVIVAAAETWFAEAVAKSALIAGSVDGIELIERCGVSGWLVNDSGEVLTAGDPPGLIAMSPANVHEAV
jgi:FAD:protein FMN transferase